jgi:hypothetical protein
VTAIVSAFPERTCDISGLGTSNITLMRPPTVSCSAPAVPLYGTMLHIDAGAAIKAARRG